MENSTAKQVILKEILERFSTGEPLADDSELPSIMDHLFENKALPSTLTDRLLIEYVGYLKQLIDDKDYKDISAVRAHYDDLREWAESVTASPSNVKNRLTQGANKIPKDLRLCRFNLGICYSVKVDVAAKTHRDGVRLLKGLL